MPEQAAGQIRSAYGIVDRVELNGFGLIREELSNRVGYFSNGSLTLGTGTLTSGASTFTSAPVVAGPGKVAVNVTLPPSLAVPSPNQTWTTNFNGVEPNQSHTYVLSPTLPSVDTLSPGTRVAMVVEDRGGVLIVRSISRAA